jgi:hypothetical protein
MSGTILHGRLVSAEESLHRIGVITVALGNSAAEQGLRAGLRELGYIEGKNLAIEWQRTMGSDAELQR